MPMKEGPDSLRHIPSELLVSPVACSFHFPPCTEAQGLLNVSAALEGDMQAGLVHGAGAS